MTKELVEYLIESKTMVTYNFDPKSGMDNLEYKTGVIDKAPPNKSDFNYIIDGELFSITDEDTISYIETDSYMLKLVIEL